MRIPCRARRGASRRTVGYSVRCCERGRESGRTSRGDDMTNGERQTKGRGRLFDSVVETVGDTPCIRINNLAPKNATIYVKAEFFKPAGPVTHRRRCQL